MSEQRDELFARAPLPRAFTKMCLPVVTGMLVSLLYNMVDTWFIGRMNDANQMAAVSLCSPVFIILMGLGNIFGIGGSSVISRLMGEGKHDRVRRACATCYWAGILVGVAVGILLLLGRPVLLPLLGTSENTLTPTRQYVTILLCASPLVLMNFTLLNILRCDGAAGWSMAGSIAGSVVNMVLDPVLIFACHMGVTGAALATVAGYIAGNLVFGFYVLRRSRALTLALKEAAFDREILGGVFAIGLPASITNVLSSVSNIFLNNLLLPFGDTAIATMGIALKVNSIVTLLQVGFAGGMTPILGYNFGAKNAARLRQVLKGGGGFVLCLGTVLSVLVYAFAGPMIALFMNTEEIVTNGTVMLRALMLCGPFLGLLFIMTNYFQANGKALPALLLSLCRQGLVFLGVLLLMSSLFGWNGIIYAQPVADYLTLILASVMFVRVLRKDLRGM